MTIDAASAPDTNSANAPASTMVVLDSSWMPWATPDTAERMNAAVSTTMIVASTPAPGTPSTPAGGLHAAADLERAQAQRGRGAEQRREDREDVDAPADGALGGLAADQRDEGLADELTAALAEGGVGDGEADDDINGHLQQCRLNDEGHQRDRDAETQVEKTYRADRFGESCDTDGNDKRAEKVVSIGKRAFCP